MRNTPDLASSISRTGLPGTAPLPLFGKVTPAGAGQAAVLRLTRDPLAPEIERSTAALLVDEDLVSPRDGFAAVFVKGASTNSAKLHDQVDTPKSKFFSTSFPLPGGRRHREVRADDGGIFRSFTGGTRRSTTCS